ncbi:acyltransferase family protein [uncultured Pluralibacter sp.]|uniref:acyltransferase family protein n=1 Tax=uncultured Pluralibacter sp. TaxID=1490864 RepID=UPI002613BC33|nr:acyltransferase family protein [uncultured Pluralibacter sp.]
MRNISLDILKVVLAIFVFSIHIQLFAKSLPVTGYLLTDGIFRLAVPLFIVINGFFLARIIGTDKVNGFLKKLLTLYILWMLIYAKYWFDINNIPRTLITAVFGCFQLWYIPAVFLSTLMLNRLYQHSGRFFAVLCSGLFIIGLVVQAYVNATSTGLSLADKLFRLFYYRNFLFDGFPFLCLGYFTGKHIERIKMTLPARGPLFLIAAVMLVLLIGESCLYLSTFGLDSSNDLLIMTVPLSVLIFLIFSFVINIQGSSRAIASFSSAFFFSHLLCIFIAKDILLYLGDTQLNYHVVLSLALSAVVSLILVRIKSRYPRMPLVV